MSKTFRVVQESFPEPKELSGADPLGQLFLKPGSQFFGSSCIAIATAGADHTYELKFTVAEPNDNSNPVPYEVVLVDDLAQFRFDGSALLLGELRGLGNCGGYIFLVAPSESPVEMFPALATLEVKSYLS